MSENPFKCHCDEGNYIHLETVRTEQYLPLYNLFDDRRYHAWQAGYEARKAEEGI